MTDNKYIGFYLVEKKAKTDIYNVFNSKTSDILGAIKWHGSWRQYCFFPNGESIWNVGCLKTVIEFINNLMKQREDQ